MNAAILNRVGLNITDQSFIKPKDYEFQTLQSELSFRRTADGLNVRNGSTANVQELLGESLVWNQLGSGVAIPFDIDNTTGTDTIYTFLEDIQGYTTSINGHKIAAQVYGDYSGVKSFYFNDKIQHNLQNLLFFTANTELSDRNTSVYVEISAGQRGTGSVKVRFYDLTLMFGAGNEPTTIEEFYARCPQNVDMNTYNEGEVIHMEADAIKSVGVNQWDEEWEVGEINSNVGENVSSTTKIRSKSFIPILPNTLYYCKSPKQGYAFFYDENKGYIKGYNPSIASIGLTVPNNAHYMRFHVGTTKDPLITYQNDICINLSDDSINGNYFPYVKREQTLEIIKKYFPQGMKSAGTAHDEIRWNEQKQKWEAIKRIGEVDMGSLPFALNYADTHHIFIVNYMQNFADNFPNHRAGGIGALCSKFTNATWSFIVNYTSNNNDDTFCLSDSQMGANALVIRDTSYTDATSFKAAMSGVMLYYELAEPIVTEIEENFNLDYEVWNGGTEQMIADTPSTPVLANIRYKVNKTN